MWQQCKMFRHLSILAFFCLTSRSLQDDTARPDKASSSSIRITPPQTVIRSMRRRHDVTGAPATTAQNVTFNWYSLQLTYNLKLTFNRRIDIFGLFAQFQMPILVLQLQGGRVQVPVLRLAWWVSPPIIALSIHMRLDIQIVSPIITALSFVVLLQWYNLQHKNSYILL